MFEDLKKRFIVSSLLTVILLILSPFVQEIVGYSLRFKYDIYLLLFLASVIFFYGGYPFFRGFFREVRRFRMGMMTLISLAIFTSYGYSFLVVFGVEGKLFFWELATLIDIMLLGHMVEMRSISKTKKSIEDLAKLLPSYAHVVVEEEIKDVETAELKKGEIVLVKQGEKIPSDGEIVEGESEIDESIISGESRFLKKGVGDNALGGSINKGSILKVKITKVGSESYISQILELVKRAREEKSGMETLADRAAFFLTVAAIFFGGATLFFWIFVGKGFGFALGRMVSLMVITCPHALGLAIPLVVSRVFGICARNGIIVRNKASFERAYELENVVFDKTGTLTKGEFVLTEIKSFEMDERELISYVASLEARSTHFLAKAILEFAKKRNIPLKKVENFKEVEGVGVFARVDGRDIGVGSRKILRERLSKKGEGLLSREKTHVFVTIDEELKAMLFFGDSIREGSFDAISGLKKMHIKTFMITGDNNKIAKEVAKEVGVDSFFAEVLPHEKASKVKDLRKVAMVGDGVNDAPALAVADVGIAIGAGVDIAIESADVVLVKSDPRNVLDLVSLSKLARKKMIQNLIWATFYNLFAIPAASGIFGISISPALAAIFMSVSTLVVAFNARMVRYKKNFS